MAEQMYTQARLERGSCRCIARVCFVGGTHGPLIPGELEEAVKWSHIIRYIVDADRIATN